MKAALLIAILLLLQTSPTAHMSTAAGITPIQHLIIIMQENHSFDNYFGTYPTANGSLVNNITSHLTPVNGIPDGICQPSTNGCIAPHLADSPAPSNPGEGQLIYEKDYSNGGEFPTYSGPQSMVYFDYHDIPAYWDYAQLYGLADNYFAPVLAQTIPNRLMLFAGDSPVRNNVLPPPQIPYNQTILGQLDSAGISWGYYDFRDLLPSSSQNFPLMYFSGSNSSAKNVHDVSALFQDLAQNSGLPAVSFVNSQPTSLDEHPPNDVTAGELWVVSVVNAVMDSNYWSSSAILVTYDEGGGFYDHVTPPSLYSIDHGFTTPLQGLGQRVPLLVISPYSRPNFVSHILLSHLSILHMIEYNWGLQTLNPRVSASNLPLDFFDFTHTPRRPVLLGNGAGQTPISYPLSLAASSQAGTAPAIVYTLLPAILAVAAILVYAWWSHSRSRTLRGPAGEV
jgi:phospholipase C